MFVIERAETMNDQAANRMLKTLEEPPPFAHLVLLTDRLANVLPTIASRCQHVRFEAPTADELSARLQTRNGVPPATADACARLARGDGDRALALALGEGPALRGAAEDFARAALHGKLASRPWITLLERARARGEIAGADVVAKVAADAEMLPAKEGRKAIKDGGDGGQARGPAGGDRHDRPRPRAHRGVVSRRGMCRRGHRSCAELRSGGGTYR